MTKLSLTSKRFLKVLCALLMALLAYLSVTSCKSTSPIIQYVETNTHDTIVVRDIKYDSIYHTDSIYEYMYIKGDTVVHDKIKYVVQYKYSTKHDSIYVNRTDTIVCPVFVEKNLTKWQNLKIKYGGYLIAFAVLLMLVLFISLIYYLRGGFSSKIKKFWLL